MLEKIRQVLKDGPFKGGILIGRTDEWLDCYYTPQKDRFAALTGFTGSAGFAYIDLKKAVLLVDSRYTEQAKIQSSFEVLEIPRETTLLTFLKQTRVRQIGYHPAAMSVASVEKLTEALAPACTLKPLPNTLLKIITGPTSPLKSACIAYPPVFSGETTASKKKRLSAFLQKKGLDAFLLSDPAAVSWLKNERSRVNPEFPVVFERGVFEVSGRYSKLGPQTPKELVGKTLGFDPHQLPQAIYERLRSQVKMSACPCPIDQMKALKNAIQQNNLRAACLNESAVVCCLLAALELRPEKLTELDIPRLLKSYRCKDPLYWAESFETIAASGAHAALPHYLATKISNQPVRSAPMLMIDTGAHYLNGTTDMTRTICTGTPTPLMIRRYTQVLKGHIALATTPLKQGDTPALLDQRARAALKADGADYGHATGHGIGMMLGVHEAPPIIHEKDTTPLEPGFVFSNEPGYYDIENGFGIRLENMLLTQAGKKGTLLLENLLFIPFDPRLTDVHLLTREEKNWLAVYHKQIETKIFPRLKTADKKALSPFIDFFKSLKT